MPACSSTRRRLSLSAVKISLEAELLIVPSQRFFACQSARPCGNRGNISLYDAQGILPNHFLHFRDHLLYLQRLSKKTTVDWLFGFSRRQFTGNKDDLDGRPPLTDGVSQPEAIHAAGHLNVRKQKLDIRAGFKKASASAALQHSADGEQGIRVDLGVSTFSLSKRPTERISGTKRSIRCTDNQTYSEPVGMSCQHATFQMNEPPTEAALTRSSNTMDPGSW
jgi:hypothetical protein